MRLAIIGSRYFQDMYKLKACIATLFNLTPNTEIVSGGAPGADTLARQFANERGYKIKEFLPRNGKTFGQKCYNRNKEIVEYADTILAFWDGRIEHCGTLLTMQLAVQKRKTMYCIGVIL